MAGMIKEPSPQNATRLSRERRLKLDDRLLWLYVELRKSPQLETVENFRNHDEVASKDLPPAERSYLERGIEAMEVLFGLLPPPKP